MIFRKVICRFLGAVEPACCDLPCRPPAFLLCTVVRLVEDLHAPAGVIPCGTEATVLQVFGDRAEVQVEFDVRWEVPETVLAELLEPV